MDNPNAAQEASLGVLQHFERLFELRKPEKLAQLRGLLAADEVDFAALFDLVPRATLNFALAMSVPMGREEIVSNLQAEDVRRAEEVQALLEGDLAFMVRDKRLFVEPGPDVDRIPAPREVFNSIEAITSASALRFVGAGPGSKIAPSVRVVFFGTTGRVLLDSLLDWDDLAQVIAHLARVLNSQVSSVESMLSPSSVAITGGELKIVLESIEEAIEALGQVREKVPSVIDSSPE